MAVDNEEWVMEGDPVLPGGYSREVLEQTVPAAREFAAWLRNQISSSGERRIEVVIAGVSILSHQLMDGVIERFPERAGGIDDAVAWIVQASIDSDVLIREDADMSAAEAAARELDL